jgi:hypothetical protein
MPKAAFFPAALAAFLAACSNASAASVDSANDVHCYALAYGFRIAADSQKAAAEHRHATAVIEQWYGAKLDEAVRNRGADRVTREAAPVAQAFDTDFQALKAPYLACTERAASDRAFNRFAAAHPRR